MFVLAAPRVTACCENLLSFPSPSRGTPKPAESFLNTKEFEEATSERTTGFRFTARSVGSPARGGRGGAAGMRPPPARGGAGGGGGTAPPPPRPASERHQVGVIQPAPHAARHPPPARAVTEGPTAIVVGGPSPRGGRYPGVADRKST